MRALLVNEFGGPEALELADVAPPDPGPGEVVVQARAIGVNFPDLLVIGGTYQTLRERPFSPGKEVAGGWRPPDRASRPRARATG